VITNRQLGTDGRKRRWRERVKLASVEIEVGLQE